MLEHPWKDLSLLSKGNFKTLIWIGSWRCLLPSLYLLNNTKRKQKNQKTKQKNSSPPQSPKHIITSISQDNIFTKILVLRKENQTEHSLCKGRMLIPSALSVSPAISAPLSSESHPSTLWRGGNPFIYLFCHWISPSFALKVDFLQLSPASSCQPSNLGSSERPFRVKDNFTMVLNCFKQISFPSLFLNSMKHLQLFTP